MSLGASWLPSESAHLWPIRWFCAQSPPLATSPLYPQRFGEQSLWRRFCIPAQFRNLLSFCFLSDRLGDSAAGELPRDGLGHWEQEGERLGAWRRDWLIDLSHEAPGQRQHSPHFPKRCCWPRLHGRWFCNKINISFKWEPFFSRSKPGLCITISVWAFFSLLSEPTV